VTTDLTPRTDVVVPVHVHRRRGWLLVGVALFQLWLWGTRIVNLLAEVGSFSAAFIAVHAVLYVAAIGVAIVVGGLGLRQLREARAGGRA
jgi:hypothetical protein